ncbi:unnamed protein product [Auanema sp. JU1783]|nr:unnamed protein product [Auanema sp. JU1783]
MAASYSIILQIPKERLFTRSTDKAPKKTLTTDANSLPNTTRSPIRQVSEAPVKLTTEEDVSQSPDTTTKKLQKSTLPAKVKATTLAVRQTGPTIGTTTKSPAPRCFDQYINCAGVKNLCKESAYAKIMRQSCAKTCNMCKEFVRLPIEERCVDKYPDECPTWAENSFCRSTFYTFEEKMERCIKTCKLC